MKCYKIFKILFIVFAIVFIGYVQFVHINAPLESNLRQYFGNKFAFGEITKDSGLVQRIDTGNDVNIVGINLRLATYARNNTNTNQFKLYLNGNEKYKHNISSSSIKNNEFYSMEGINIEISQADETSLQWMSEDGETGNATTVWVIDDGKNHGLYKYDKPSNTYSSVKGKLDMQILANVNMLDYIAKKYGFTHSYPVRIFFLFITIFMSALLYVNIFFSKDDASTSQFILSHIN